jgi:dihydrofolate reductase
MRLNLIYAQAKGRVIGHQGTMPWHLPEDLAHFKRQTMNAPVIMGRKTWDSIPEKFRPLPGRRNVVITRQSDWRAPGAEAVHSLEDAMAVLGDAPEVWVMGGAQIYAQALPFAHRAVVTVIDAEYPGDAFAPELSDVWQERAREHHVAANGLHFAFVTYEREGA